MIIINSERCFNKLCSLFVKMAKARTVQSQEQKQKELFGEITKLKREAKIRTELKSLAIFGGLLTAAVAGRVAMQWIPSVEPIIPFAVLAGLLFGAKEGFTLGGAAYIISNFFVWGLQGPWTIFQAIGAASAGLLAGVWGKMRKPNWKDIVFLSVIGTVLFECVMNVSGSLMGIGFFGAFGFFTIPMYFLTSLPFSIVHIGSNMIFARALAPLLKFRRTNNEIKIISVNKLVDGKPVNIRLYKSSEQ
jgi:hypothetical protein